MAIRRKHCGAIMISFFLLLIVLGAPVLLIGSRCIYSADGHSSGLMNHPNGGMQVDSTREQRRAPTEQELELERKAELARRKQEYEKTKKMAEDLVKMTQDLKDSIDKAGQDTLPLNAFKKLEEIESLSKKIKSRLKDGS